MTAYELLRNGRVLSADEKTEILKRLKASTDIDTEILQIISDYKCTFHSVMKLVVLDTTQREK